MKAVRLAGLVLTITALPALGACTQIRGHQGFVVDGTLVNTVQPGIDNKRSVIDTLGRPTFEGQFDKNDWYYVARDTRQLAFASPKPTEQVVLRVKFDDAGNVVDVQRTGVELAVNLTPDGDKTPTLGRERGFFEDLFGNIGAVGAPIGGAGGAGPGGR